MRTIERQILKTIKQFEAGDMMKEKTRQLSQRDQVVVENGRVSVKLWGKTIAVIRQEQIELSSRGYRTNTTKSRLNAILQGLGSNYRICQKDFSWYVLDTSAGVYMAKNSKLFQDGDCFLREV